MLKISQLYASILIVLLMISMNCWADDLTLVNEQPSVANQEMEVESSGAIFKIQKQPAENGSCQKITVKKSGLCVLIQINGKVTKDKE